VQIFCRDGLASLEAVDLLLRSIGLGEIDGATDGIIVLTFPSSATFQRIEDVIQRVVEHIDALSWQYGNVYADNGCGEPLNWWLNS
jgi:hypothetical protein